MLRVLFCSQSEDPLVRVNMLTATLCLYSGCENPQKILTLSQVMDINKLVRSLSRVCSDPPYPKLGDMGCFVEATRDGSEREWIAVTVSQGVAHVYCHWDQAETHTFYDDVGLENYLKSLFV